MTLRRAGRGPGTTACDWITCSLRTFAHSAQAAAKLRPAVGRQVAPAPALPTLELTIEGGRSGCDGRAPTVELAAHFVTHAYSERQTYSPTGAQGMSDSWGERVYAPGQDTARLA